MTKEPNNANFHAIIAPEIILSDMDAIKAFFSPLRQRIMRAMAHQPRTVQSVAEELDIPSQRLYYHFNMLERHKLIQLVGVRVLSGAVEEKYYQITAYVYRVDRRLRTMGVKDDHHDAVESLLDIVWDEARLNIRRGLLQGVIAPEPLSNSLYLGQRIAHLSSEQAARFYQRIQSLLDEFDRSSEDGSARYALTVALHPSGD